MAGAFTGPADWALLVFRTAGRSVVEEFVVTSGLVTGWEIRPWNVVIGANGRASC